MIRTAKSLLPIYDSNTKLMVLGTIPGEAAEKNLEYYSENGNKFWKIMFSILKEDIDVPYNKKVDVLLKHRIGFWDAFKSAVNLTGGSKDSDIDVNTVIFNNFDSLPNHIESFIFNGTCNTKNGNCKALNREIKNFFYKKDENVEYCPSTSSLNIYHSMEEIEIHWKEALEKLNII